jgi:DNA-binding Lrp family transcriptional regulator
MTLRLPTAYVLILCDYSHLESEIICELRQLPNITEVNRVDGPYDIIVKLSDNSMEAIRESIGKHMTKIRGIQSTITLMAEQ